MSPTLAARPLSTLAFFLAGSALLTAPALAAEEEAQAQERIGQAEVQQEENGTAEAPSHNHDHNHSQAVNGEDEHADNEAVQAYRDVNRRMHEDMSVEFTGNPDADFARAMIPHHQGAIDMANVVLLHGEDEAIRDLAHEIIEAQEEEIAFLRDWLAQHGFEAE